MSRSRKKHPGGGMTTSMSDKPGKVIDNRRYRHYSNQMIRQGEEEIEHPHHKTNPWNWPKDGKQYWDEGKTWNNGEWMRK
jgi:hypothetical protein